MRRRSVVEVVCIAAVALSGAAACAVANLPDEEDGADLPRRQVVDGDTDGSANEGSSPDEASADVATGDAADGGVNPCGTIDGSTVYCVGRSEPFTTTGTITYGTGFTGPLPAMGLGRPGLGYVPIDYPFTCVAAVGTRGVPPPNNVAGKICEVHFDNTNTMTVMGTATYTVQANADAAAGIYELGLTSNAGTTIAEPSFYLRIVP